MQLKQFVLAHLALPAILYIKLILLSVFSSGTFFFLTLFSFLYEIFWVCNPSLDVI